MAKVEIQTLRKEFSVPTGIETAVDDISFTIDDEEFISVLGPSGCGKTTTLRCIAGLETPTSGSVSFGGRDVTHLPANKRDIALMFQNIALYPHMTIRENIGYPLKVRHVKNEQRNSEVDRVAELMQISELLDKYPGELSGGQRQRAALARTIIQDPVVFLMDEPLSDLDAKLKAEIRKEIQRIHRQLQGTTIYVTHDQEEAMTMSDRIIVMNQGDIVQIGTPRELYIEPINKFVAQFIGNPSMNFIDVDVESRNRDSVDVSIDNTIYSLSMDPNHDLTGSVVTVGFRPESVSFESSGNTVDIEAEVILTEYIGDRMLVTLEGSQGELRAAADPEIEVDEGEKTTISVAKSSIYLFDDKTDNAIKTGGSEYIVP